MLYLLHISDLHLVVDPLWNNMENAILSAVQEKLRGIPKGQKMLVITGDFHNFVENHFQQAETFLPKLFDAMGIDPALDVFVIPGNHDISKDIPKEIDREVLIEAIKSNPNLLHTRMEKFLACYDGYLKLVKGLNIYKSDCGTRPVEVHVRTWRQKLKLLHLNTTLVADGKAKEEQMADTFTATSDSIRQELADGNLPCIAIGHNSFFDLLKDQRESLAGMYWQANISAYLCGDRHQKNSDREKKLIILKGCSSSVTIPNIVSYRTSADENDTYSDFGMIWNIWEEDTGRVRLEYMKWDPCDQGELQPDGEWGYSFREIPQKAKDTEPAPRQYKNESWLSNSDLIKKGSVPIEPFHIRNFLLGGKCYWNIAFSDNQIVRRNVIDDLYQCAIDGGIYALTGPGGEGKTTVLMQLCALLVRKGISVYYYHGHSTVRFPEDIREHSVMVLDNPSDNQAFKRFLDGVIDEGLTLILGARENEWNLLKRRLEISGRDIQEISIEKLAEKEAGAFAECVYNNMCCSRTKGEIKEIFLTNSYGFLYAAMLMVVNNSDSLEDIAHQIISNLKSRSSKALFLFAHIIMSEHYEIKFTDIQFKEICKELEMTARDGSRALSREAFPNGGVYQTRHEVISKLFYKELFSDSGDLDLDKVDRVLTNLMEFQFKKYRISYGLVAQETINAIMCLCGALEQTSFETREYLIERLIDELKQKPPHYYYQLPSYIEDEEVQLLFYQKCFDRNWISPAFLSKWCSLLEQKGAPWNISEPYSPAWIMRRACMEENGTSGIWLQWALMETRQNGAGDYAAENSGRWIYREACLNHKADSKTWLGWAQLEEKENNIGDCETGNTARWVYREACLNHSVNGDVWLGWARLEEKENNIGDCETGNTARWVYREACLNHNVDGKVWLGWALLEARENNIGNYGTGNTARWVYREACLNRKADSQVWLGWARLEARENNIGNYGTENTARWVYREACLNRKADSNTWLGRAQLEARENNIGNYGIENTARWVYREACLNHKADSQVWLGWAQLEARENNIGSCGTENTARWVYREACLNRKADSNTWLGRAQLEARENNIGNYGIENTARWVYREACLNHKADGSVWLGWGQLENRENNFGDCETENTARWIFAKALKCFPDLVPLYIPYAKLELSHGNASKARDILRQSLRHSDFSVGQLAVLEFFYGNIDSGDNYCTKCLMDRMKLKADEVGYAALYLYHCSCLLKQADEAEQYYQMLLKNPNYNSDNNSAEVWIHLCEEKIALVKK